MQLREVVEYFDTTVLFPVVDLFFNMSPPRSPATLTIRKSSIRVTPAAYRRSSHSIRNLLSFTHHGDKKDDDIDIVELDVPVATNKAWIIRVACGQIVHALDDVSDALSHQLLQELCAELVVRSSEVIQSKVDKSDQSPKQKENVGGDPTQDDHRQAERIEMMEKRVSSHSQMLSKRIIVKNNFSPPIKSPDDNVLSMFPNDDDGKSYHTLEKGKSLFS